jgi:hypothetical protein
MCSCIAVLIRVSTKVGTGIYFRRNRNFDFEIGISISIIYFRRNRNSDVISFWFRRNFILISSKFHTDFIEISFWFRRNFDSEIGISVSMSKSITFENWFRRNSKVISIGTPIEIPTNISVETLVLIYLFRSYISHFQYPGLAPGLI